MSSNKSEWDRLHRAVSPLGESVVRLTESFARANLRHTEVVTAGPDTLGFEGSRDPDRNKNILKEMESIVPISSIPLEQFTRNPEHRNTFFKVGLVYAADSHTYLAVHAREMIDRYRGAFRLYANRIPNVTQSLAQTEAYFPTGFPEGRSAKFLPLHTIVWCFLEKDGQVLPIDALSLLSGQGQLEAYFTADSREAQESLDQANLALREEVLVTMCEYSHVAAVAMFDMYENYLMQFFITSVQKYGKTIGLTLDTSDMELLQKNFSIARKGIRRHMNVGYDPSSEEAHEWFSLLDGTRDSVEAGRGPASQPSAHIFLREIPFKKWCRIVLENFQEQKHSGEFTSEQYEQLDQLTRLALREAPDIWSPDREFADDNSEKEIGPADLSPDKKIFKQVSRSKIVGEDPERYIKSLDPYANWEASEIATLLLPALEERLKQFGVSNIAPIHEFADAMVPYNRQISGVTMQFPSNNAIAHPGRILPALGDILGEIYQEKRSLFEPNRVKNSLQFIDQSLVGGWLDKLRGYHKSRKQVGDQTDYRYSLENPQLSQDETFTHLLRQYNSSDRNRVFEQFLTQVFLYNYEEIENGAVPWESAISRGDATQLLEQNLATRSAKINLTWQLLQFAHQKGMYHDEIQAAFDRIMAFTRDPETNQLDEEKLIEFLVIRKLENERLGIRAKDQRSLNSTRLPGFLVSYDYLQTDRGEVLQFTISPVISERGSMEQIKGLLIKRMLDKLTRVLSPQASANR